MNKLNVHPLVTYQSSAQPAASTLGTMPVKSSLRAIRRLIVLVPDEPDDITATRRVSELAHALDCPVLFLGLCADKGQEASWRRRLITMSAIVADGKLSTDLCIERGDNWANALKSTLQDGDMVACFAEHRVGYMQRPLNQILESQLSIPLYILSGSYPESRARSDWRSQILLWLSSLVIIAGGFLLQVQIASFLGGWAQTILLIISVIAEVWLIWMGNKLFA